MSEAKERLKKTVNFLKYKIKNFDKEKLLTEDGNEEYNKLVVQKAVVSHKLNCEKNNQNTILHKFFRKIKGKTLICDRF